MSLASPNPRWRSPPPTYDSHSSDSTLKPYLQLPHLLSLTWLAYPILSLLFVIFRLQLSLASSQDAVADAKTDLLASCKAAEKAATAAASMPRYMAVATNQQFAEAVNGSMDAARAALVLALTVMEAIINFIVDIYRSTFLCFVELVVRGGLSILISAVQELNSFVQSTASSIRTGIQSDISSANSAIETAVSAINKINPFGNISVPQFSIPSLSGLENITLPTDFENSLVQLNSSLPTFADIKDKIESIIDTPFELLKQEINGTFGNLSFDSSVLPVPQQNVLTFCNDLDTSVVDDLGNDLIKVAKIGTIILILLALLLLAANCLLEWYKWRCMKRHLEYTRQAWVSDPTLIHSGPSRAPQITLSDHNLLMLQATGSHPLLTRIANTIAARLRLSPVKHTHLQWFFHYVFHPPALACFLIGFFGLLSVEIQLIAIGPLAARYADRAAASATDFSNTIATSINASMYNQSAAYATDINSRVDVIQSTINNGVFGWVNVTTTTLNDTIVEFYTDIQDAVNTVFNGTILDQPAQEFIKCFIGSKVDAIETALTFLHDNLKVNIPRVNDSVLVLSPAHVNEAVQPIATAAIGGGQDDKEGLIGKLVNAYAESLRKERFMFAIFMALWGFVVLMALCIIAWNSYGRTWLQARRKRKWEREQRGIDDITMFRGVGNRNEVKEEVKPEPDLPSFTPLPSPRPGFALNPFNRSTSPAPKSTLSETKQEKSWDNFFSGRKRNDSETLSISKPMKLMSVRKSNELVMDEERQPRDVSNDLQSDDTRPTWISRLTSMVRRKEQGERDATADIGSRGRPNLRISIHRASSLGPVGLPRVEIDDVAEPSTQDKAVPRSAWSESPTPIQTTVPWMNRIVTTPKREQHQFPVGFPPRPNQPDVDSVYGSSETVQPTPLAMPFHHGFSRAHKRSSTPPVVKILPLQPHYTLGPPPDRHRRNPSVPSPSMENSPSITPVTRLLTTTHARQSSSINPFATPFDDEHRVTITAPPLSNARRSIPTNPFIPVAM